MLAPGSLVRASLVALAATAMGCASSSYSIAVEAPARDVASPPRTLVVHDYAGSYGSSVAEAVRNGIAQQGFIRVADRTAEAVMRGSVSVGRVETSEQNRTVKVPDIFEGEMKEVRKYFVRKRLLASVTYSLHRGGQRLAGNTFSYQFDNEWSHEDRARARSMAPTDDLIIGAVLSNLAHEVVVAVSPHRKEKQLDLQKGTHPGLAQGIVYMQHERLDQAVAIWHTVLEQTSDPTDRAAAYYNLGVVQEARGDYEAAFAHFREADRALPAQPRILEALTRVENERMDSARVHGATGPVARLTVQPVPSDSRVRIMNIGPKYRPGIHLSPGRYDVLVDRPGYVSQRHWVTMSGTDVTLDVVLEKEP